MNNNNNNRRGRRTPRNAAAVTRAVTSKIRSLNLNHAPGFVLSRTRNTDPPVAKEYSIYERRVRIVGTVPLAGLSVTPSVVYTAAGVNGTVFPQFTIKSWSLYGSTNTGVRIQPNLIVSNNGTVLGSVFDDFGVAGARRPHVRVTVSPRDMMWLSSTATVAVGHVSGLDETTGDPIAANLIVDIIVQFRGTAVALKAAKAIEISGVKTNPIYESESDSESVVQQLDDAAQE